MMKNSFQEYLKTLFQEKTVVDEAVNYALLGDGKRVRPLLLLNFLKDCDTDIEYGFPAAAALEMIHTYSLIHDDLPAMDNDDLRRGKPTVHKQFDEATAILAGDALLTKAFELLTEYDGDICRKLVQLYAQSSGNKGMIKGQILDISYENSEHITLDELKTMDNCKTGYLIRLPLLTAEILANESITNLGEIGFSLGLAFQIQDDILDYTSNEIELGKSTSDATNNKSTYYTLLGHNEAQALCDELYESVLKELPEKFVCLKEYIQQLRYRGK